MCSRNSCSFNARERRTVISRRWIASSTATESSCDEGRALPRSDEDGPQPDAPIRAQVRSHKAQRTTRTGIPTSQVCQPGVVPCDLCLVPCFVALSVLVLRERRPARHPVGCRRRGYCSDKGHRLEEPVVRRLYGRQLTAGKRRKGRLEVRRGVIRTGRRRKTRVYTRSNVWETTARHIRHHARMQGRRDVPRHAGAHL